MSLCRWVTARSFALGRAFGLALGCVLFASAVAGCATDRGGAQRHRTSDANEHARIECGLLPAPLELGTFPRDAHRGVAVDAIARASCTALRATLERAPVGAPLPKELSELLARAAHALRENNAELAMALANEAQRLAPDCVEPLELMLVAGLAQDRVEDVRTTLDRIAALDQRNSIGVAFRGLHALAEGRLSDAMSYFAWFVGPDALARRGACISFPIPDGELEEQAAICALRLGLASAAIEFLTAAAQVQSANANASARVAVLRSDAHVMLGEFEAAQLLLHPLAALNDLHDATDFQRALSALARLRLDAIAHASDDDDGRLRSAARDFQNHERDDVAFWRVLAAAECASKGEMAATQHLLESGTSASAPRSLMLRVLIDGESPVKSGNFEVITAILSANLGDSLLLCAALRSVASCDGAKAVALVGELLRAHANDLDTLVDALLASGIELDAIVECLARSGPTAESDAIQSRILAKCRFVEEALLVAEAARARDAARDCVLAASARAAAELADETLLTEIDDAARAAPNGIARTLAECWLTLGDAPRAHDRAEQALRSDPQDSRARELVERAKEMVTSGEGAAAIRESSSTETTQQLIRAGLALEHLRSPLGLECLALAEAIDPTAGALDEIAKNAQRSASAETIARWVDRMSSAAPALPSRRSLARVLDRESIAVSSIPRSPLSARFDARCVAPESLRAADALAQSQSRPQTIEAIAAEAHAALRTGDIEHAATLVTQSATRPSRVINSRAAQSLLAAATTLAREDSSRAQAMWDAATKLAVKLTSASPSDLFAILQLASATAVGSEDRERMIEQLARAVRSVEDDSLVAYFDLFEALTRLDGDPFPAARLAAALANETRFAGPVRARLGASAVALYAAAAAAAESKALVASLAADGVVLFARGEERELSLGVQWSRAAEVHELLGDSAGNELLLGAALEAEPSQAEALNNLAYALIRRGVLTERVATMIEQAAAAAPDNPAILDTLGLLRYHQGRFRDDARATGAITLFRQALRLRPNDPSLGMLDRLGDALWREGEQDEATRCWQQVEELASLRYPPEPIARSLVEYQRRTLGVRLVDPAEYVRRLYGDTVESARRKLQQVSAGESPALPPCAAVE